ncbi:MAG: hypothetical protein WC150_03465 [Bacteroidia bacterium]
MKTPLSNNRFLMVILFTGALSLNMKCETDNERFQDSQENLPPLTFWGFNTMGCKLDGQNWVAYSATSFPHLSAYYDKGKNRFYFSGVIKEKNKESFQNILVQIINPKEGNTFVLSEGRPDSNYAYYVPIVLIGGGGGYYTNDSLTGQVHLIKFDTVYQIASGTFKFKCTNGAQIKNITEGRFDVSYAY